MQTPNTFAANGTKRKWKIKHIAAEMREKIMGLSVPGILAVPRKSFPLHPHWFGNESRRQGRLYSVRNVDETLFVFRLK
jgi:hypothetical protein